MARRLDYGDTFDRSRGRADAQYYSAENPYGRRRGSRDGSANSAESREGGNPIRPSYRHLDADAHLRARLQRPPDISAAFHTERRPFVDQVYSGDERHGRDYYELLPQPRSRIAIPNSNVYNRAQQNRRSSDLLNPIPEVYQLPNDKGILLDDGFDLELTFQREDSWAPSAIDSESSLSTEFGSPEKEGTEGQATILNILTSWAWGHGSNLSNGGELYGFKGPSNRKQACHFRWSHMEQNNMNFDSFFENAVRTAGLKGAESNAVLKSQETIRARFVKPVTSGQTVKGRQMMPNAFFGNLKLENNRPIRADRLAIPRTSVLFFSLPFFVLREFAENNLPVRSGLFPTRALLQSQNSAIKKARELSQASRRLFAGDRDVCLHVSQAWCLAIGDDYLFTCSTLSLEDLVGEGCKINIQPRPDRMSPPTVQGRQYITIRSTNEVVVLPLDECKTWVEFMSHFAAETDNFEETYFVKWQGREATSETWTSVYKNALTSNFPLYLEARRPRRGDFGGPARIRADMTNPYEDIIPRAPFQPPLTRQLRSEPIPAAYFTDLYTLKPEVANQTPDLESFHVFTWISTVPGGQNVPKASSSSEKPRDNLSNAFTSYILDVNRYKKARSEVGAFLNTKLNSHEAKAFRDTTERTITDVSNIHETLTQKSGPKDVGQTPNRSSKVEFAWAAKVILDFFFPEQTEDAVVRKYWGGIYDILSLPDEFVPSVSRSPEEPEESTPDWEPPRRLDRRERNFTDLSAQDGNEDYRRPTTSPYNENDSENEERERSDRRRSRQTYREDDEYVYTRQPSPSRRRRAPPPPPPGPPPAARAGFTKTFRAEDVELFISMAQRVQKLSSNFATHRKEGGRYFKIPSAFTNAWLHCLLYITQYGRSVRSSTRLAVASLQQCNSLIYQGNAEIMASLVPSPLHEKTAMQPRGMMALIINRLIEDVVGDSLDVLRTYDSYMDELKAKIEDDPLQRVHQRTISYFNEEIEAIIRVLEGQGQVIADLTDITSTGDRSYISPAASMERGKIEFGRAFDLLWEHKSFILQRIGDFTGLAKEALVLESFSRNEIETTKDRHDSAIYAFTIVTIVFLPLSFVCSFLGMNTIDIRNQDYSQWIFWAAGVPLTVLVIAVALLWSGEWRNIRDSIRSALRSEKHKLA